MVSVVGVGNAVQVLRARLARIGVLGVSATLGVLVLYGGCTSRVKPDQFGVEQRKFGWNVGIVPRTYGPGLYFVGPGVTMRTFPRTIHVLEASFDQQEAKAKAKSSEVNQKVEKYFENRDEVLGEDTHRTIEALNVQTSDGYSVTTDVTLLYAITDPVKVARDFGWGTLYVDAFVINTFRSGILATLGKMNAESFYDGAIRIKAIAEAQALLSQRFSERGFQVEKLLLRNFRYADSYEKSLQDKKVAVQLTRKNRKESLVNEEKAKLQQIDSKGNAAITIAQSEVATRVAQVRAEAELYSSERRAQADTEVNIALAEAKRLKAEALTQAGGRYVVALETARMFENIDGAVMTPEQYIGFVRNVWALIGVSPGGRAPVAGGAQ